MRNSTTCSSLFKQLEQIWDEVGESHGCHEERAKLLSEIERECLDAYKRRIDMAVKSRDQLRQKLADAKAHLFRLQCALGENTVGGIPEETSGTIEEQLAAIAPALERVYRQIQDRLKEFSNVQSQIAKSGEIPLLTHVDKVPDIWVSYRRVNGCTRSLNLYALCIIFVLSLALAMAFRSTVTEVHPSLSEEIISTDMLSRLTKTVSSLEEDKKQRLEKLQKLALQLTELWKLMDTPAEERSLFEHVTPYISATVDEVTIPGALALDLIEQAEVEVKRLDELKFKRMKEIASKKLVELEEVYARAYIQFDPSELIADMDRQIVKAKEEALSRKEILDGVEKWMLACEEESWLEDYNWDQKRAEQARILVNKIPGS